MTDGPANASETFLTLLSAHAGMLDRFLQHQEALLAQDFGRALERLLETRREFEQHVRAEEELFPRLFADNEVQGTPLDLFTGEHKHLRELLTAFESATRRLDRADPAVMRRLIELIEEEALWKSFFLHHDERERNLLYPAFDRGTTDAGRQELLSRFHA